MFVELVEDACIGFVDPVSDSLEVLLRDLDGADRLAGGVVRVLEALNRHYCFLC